jgi:hypothetical protein
MQHPCLLHADAVLLCAALCRTRITLDMMGVPLTGTFDSATETLTITHTEQEEADGQQLDPGSAAGRRMGFHQQQQQQYGSGSGGLADEAQERREQQLAAARLRLNDSRFTLKVWLDHMQGKIVNRQHIPRAELPLQVGGDAEVFELGCVFLGFCAVASCCSCAGHGPAIPGPMIGPQHAESLLL